MISRLPGFLMNFSGWGRVDSRPSASIRGFSFFFLFFLLLAEEGWGQVQPEVVRPPGETTEAAQVTTKEIEEGLTCQCGCGLTVHSCNHLQCGSAIPLKREILALVNEGKGRPEILGAFREKYGEKILSSPVAEGFNLTAWTFPFLAVAGGVVLIVVVVRRWKDEPSPKTPPSPLSEADRHRLDAELRREDS